MLSGSWEMSSRQVLIKNFNNKSEPDTFIISTKAGGMRLNLHGADRVLVLDFSWYLSDEEQAIGQAYLLRQMKYVYIVRSYPRVR